MKINILYLVAFAVVTFLAHKADAQTRPPNSELPNILIGTWKITDLTDQSKKKLQNSNLRIGRDLALTEAAIAEVKSQIYEFRKDGSYKITKEGGSDIDSGSYTLEKLALVLDSATQGQRQLDLGLVGPAELIIQPMSENAPIPGFFKMLSSQSLIWSAKKIPSAAKKSPVDVGKQADHGELRLFFVDTVDANFSGMPPQLRGFFAIPNRDDAFYIYQIDSATGKLCEVAAMYGTRIDTTREYERADDIFDQAGYNATNEKRNPTGDSYFATRISETIVNGVYEPAYLTTFEKVLPKFREWANKAKEVNPQPFKKEIPTGRKYGRYWANFIWTPEAQAKLELFEQYRGEEGSGSVGGGELLLREDEVDEIATALAVKSVAVVQLNKILKQAISKAKEDQKKIQDNFN